MEKVARNELILSCLQTIALSAIAIAQPLYDLLSKNPAFFIARHARPIDIVVMVLVLSLLMPILFILLEAGARLAGRNIWRLTHSSIVAVLAAIVFLPLMTKFIPISAYLLVGLAVIAGGGFSFILWRVRGIGIWMAYLALATFIFPLLFIFQDPIKSSVFMERDPLEFPDISSTAPVVMLILDELSVVSLMDRSMNIDRIRYPNFAGLADDAWWFRNTTTVSDDTVSGAVPAIITGIYPDKPSSYRESNQSLFTLLGGRYGMNVYETYTHICPEKLCPNQDPFDKRISLLFSDLYVVFAHVILPEDMRKNLPSISHGWKNFQSQNLTMDEYKKQISKNMDNLWESRSTWVDRFIDSFQSAEQPQLYLLHVLLPHLPWNYLPNGARYDLDANGLFGVPGVNNAEFWGKNNWAVVQGYQRHLLQVGYVDLILGRLIDRLQSEGIYDESLIVITADHGVSFRPNDGRRPFTKSNLADIMRVPLLIKAPGQQEGRISDRIVETVDIVPTIAHMLDIDIPWRVDGVSALNLKVKERAHRVIYQQNRKQKAIRHEIPEQFLNERSDALKRKIKLFGDGNSGEMIYRIGPHNDLIGKDASSLITPVANIFIPSLILDPVNGTDNGPWVVTGLLKSKRDLMRSVNIAIAVDGKICSVTRSYVNSPKEAAFVAFLSSKCQRRENSLINVFLVSGSSESPNIVKLKNNIK